MTIHNTIEAAQVARRMPPPCDHTITRDLCEWVDGSEKLIEFLFNFDTAFGDTIAVLIGATTQEFTDDPIEHLSASEVNDLIGYKEVEKLEDVAREEEQQGRPW